MCCVRGGFDEQGDVDREGWGKGVVRFEVRDRDGGSGGEKDR